MHGGNKKKNLKLSNGADWSSLQTVSFLQQPGAKYADKVFTTNAAGFPGWDRIAVKADGSKDLLLTL